MADKKSEQQEYTAVSTTHTPPPTKEKPLKLRTTYQDKKIVATRAARQGDDGYQLSTIYDQVTMIFEDGSEKVIKSSDLYEPQV